MMEIEFESGVIKSGFRLHSVELLNWGTFHRKIWKIEPQGNNSLLTGDVGSGKSTLVDALTCLIVPHHKISFNKAAGAERNERSLITYIKGEYKNTKNDDSDSRERPVTLRYDNPENKTFSVILANFTNEGYHASVCLAQVFWIENDKVQKLLIIREKEALSIKEHFSNIEDARELRKRLKELPSTQTFDDNFSQYSQRFRYLFGMQSDKAIDLFNQTVSMKSVSSLTLFVREQMLDRTEIKSHIEDLKKRFDDLNKAYAAVQEARKQRDILLPLVEYCETFRKLEERRTDIDNIISAVPAYFASRKIDLLQSEIADCERKLRQITGQLTAIEESLTLKRDSVIQVRQDIRHSGGARLEKIAEEIQFKIKLSENKKAKHKEYSELTSFCGLETAHTDKTFFRNFKHAEEKVEALRLRQEKILAAHGKLAGQKSTLEDNIQIESKELESLRQRENQIPLEFLAIRAQLADGLGIDQEEIPFAGELMKVNESEKEWEGALERLLRGFGVSMLVPEKHYPLVSSYINQRRLADNRNRGMRFEYFKVSNAYKFNKYNTEIDNDSVINKIEIKSDTFFENWLQSELEKRFNLRCVTMDEFQRMPADLLTKEGQYKVGNQRHIKDDRRELWDRRNFVLGWSNLKKIQAVERYLKELREQNIEVDKKIKEFSIENQNNTILQTRLAQLMSYKNWLELNWKDEVEAITQLEQERDEIKDSSNILRTLEQRLEVVLQEIAEQELAKNGLLETKGSLTNRTTTYSEEIEDCHAIVKIIHEDEKKVFYPKIDAELTEQNYTIRSIDRTRESFLQEKTKERNKLLDKQGRVRDKIIHTMQEYKDKFPSDSMELSDEISARGEYLSKLEKILNEGLPAHEATLKTMLNKNTIDDIVAFDNKLDIHEKEIRNRIKNINTHLKEIEYNKGTYIELIADRNRDQDIKVFKGELKACYSNILSTEDAYTEDRFNDVQKILNRFRSNDNKDIDWTNKVTDVRNWFDFNASERYIETNEEKEFYSGSSGKSGGQKEKLAYTIIASALAYQFGLKIGEPKSKSFRFAVIDEAFGKGSDASAEYGLELFKKLNLQLLIVTPLQKIHVIENYINTVHYVSNVEGNNSELQNMSIEEYRATKQLRNITTNGFEVSEIPS